MPDPTPRLHLPAWIDFEGREVVQIVASSAEIDQVQGFLRSRDCYLYEIPTSDGGPPTYGIGVSDREQTARGRRAVA